MHILAIDTSARHYSLALLEDQGLVANFESRNYRHEANSMQAIGTGDPAAPLITPFPAVSATIIPAMKDLLGEANLQISDIQLIVVATGPGMFTGLRIGLVAAKTLAYVQRIPLLGVNTLEVIAAQTANGLSDRTAVIRPVLNAQRQQLFSGAYRSNEPWEVSELSQNEIVDRETWISQLDDSDVITGSGLRPLLPGLQESRLLVERNIQIADPAVWEPSAQSVGQMGYKHFLSGRRDDLWRLEPFYFRPSAAEEALAPVKDQPAGD